MIKINGPLPNPIGVFGQTGDMYLFGNDIETSITYFKRLNYNRLLFEQKKHLERKKERENVQNFKFKP